MAGTKAGGKAAAATNKKKYGDDFYAKMGHKGGKNSPPTSRLFYVDREMASKAGRLGGKVSRRGVPLTPEEVKAIKEANSIQ